MGGKSKSWLRRLFGGGKNPEAPFGSAEDSDPKKNSKRRWPSFARSLKDTAPLKTPPPPPLLPCRGGGGGATGYLTEASATVTYSDASDDANKHAIAVAAATAAVAEAALAAAQAAAAVVRLTSGGSGRAADPAHGSSGRRRAEDMVWAAVKIQSAFRAYLARRALRALKGLVKLQALVRGHFVRKQTADMLRRMQALVRVQARARATRSHHSSVSDSPSFTSMHWSHSYIGSPTPDKFVQKFHANGTKVEGPSMLKRCASNSKARDIAPQGNEQLGPHWPEQWIEDQYSWNNLIRQGNADDENSDKIVEVDTAKPHRLSPSGSSRTFQTPQHVLSSSFSSTSRSNTTVYSPSRHPTRAQKLTPSPLSREEVYSWNNAPKARIGNKEESVLYTAESSPQVLSASSRFGSSMGRCPFTPGRSEHSRSFYAGCLDHPSYMANTESSRAKVRSQSAPRQRLYFENPAGSLTKKPIHGWDVETNSNCGWDSRSIGYTASRRFDRLLSPNLM